MGIGPNKVYSYISVAIIGFLPLASFLIFGAQWSHLALFCQNPVFLLSDGRIPDSLAFWVMASRTFSFLGGGGISLLSFVLFFNFQYLSGRPSCAFFDIAHFDILNEIFKVRSVRRLPDVTSSPGRSLSSSTNERGRSHLGCYHPVILLQHGTSGI